MPRPFESTRDLIIRTPDWEAATEFYRSIMGFQVTYEDPALVGFETGSFKLYVEKGTPHSPVFEFLVPDVQAARDQLLSAGCTLQEEDPAIPRVYLRDPYGLAFNLRETPPKAG
jgi:catechol 2,3-dioxygenase-like lactoylglutathione lyase family enzyme